MAEDFLYSEGLELEQSSQPAASISQAEASVHDAHLTPNVCGYSTNVPEFTNHRENLQSPELEDLDSYNLIEPPPLDWRSDSSSDAGSVAELEICSVGDFEAHESFNTELNEDVLSAEFDHGAQHLSEAPDKTEDLLVQEMCEIRPEISVCQSQDAPQETHKSYAGDRDRTCLNPEMKIGKIREKENDIDHSHIQSLLTQLHLFKPSTSFDNAAAFTLDHGTLHTTAESTASSSQELELSAQSACAHSDRNAPEALLFSHEYQKDLLQLLEEPEQEELRTAPEFVHTRLVTPEHQSGLRRQSSDADEVISMSQSQDAWHKHLQDEFLVSGVAEDDQWMQSEGLSANQSVSPNNDLDAETQPPYKNVPGPCDPEDLLDGVIFGAKYLGSTQLQSEKNPSTNARMAQAQEAVDRIKVEE